MSKTKLIIPAILILAASGFTIKTYFFPAEFRYAGTLEATKVDISAQLPSSIARVLVKEGDHVTANQELVSLSGEEVRIASRLANANYDRNLRLFRSGTISQDTMDQFKNRKDEADVRMSWVSIKSPLRGTVLSVYHQPGEWVAPGVKLLTLADIQNIWTYIYVPQPEIANLKVGMLLTGHLPELSGREFEGKIVKINSEAEFTPKNVQTRAERTRLVFGVKVSFQGNNNDETLKPGMTIEIQLPKK